MGVLFSSARYPLFAISSLAKSCQYGFRSFRQIFCLFVRTSLSCQFLLKQGKWKNILHFIFKFIGGRNGYGAKLCNIFSKKFTVETSCKTSKKCFRQVTNTVTINIYYHLSYTHVTPY